MVVNDSLGMAAQWEAEMSTLVDNYKCEWAEAVNNPDIRKRFTHFVNAPEGKDPTVSFVPMRDQFKAEDWKGKKGPAALQLASDKYSTKTQVVNMVKAWESL